MKKQLGNTAKKRGKQAELADWIAGSQPAEITEAHFEELLARLAPISRNYLRKLLLDSGVPLSAMVEGVRQTSFDELENSLVRLLDEYERGGAEHRQRVRELVIAAKDHARWAGRNPDRREQKEEMAAWMLTWLENPPVFPQWARLRRLSTRVP